MSPSYQNRQGYAKKLMAKINCRLQMDVDILGNLLEAQSDAMDDWTSWVNGFVPGEWTEQDEIWLNELKKQVVDNGLE